MQPYKNIINKLLKLTGTAALYLCASLFIASILLIIVLKYSWKVDGKRFQQMIAVAQGVDLARTEADIRKEIKDKAVQIGLDEIREKRVARQMDEDFAKQKGGQVDDTIMLKVRQLESDKQSHDAVAAAFEKRLKDVQEQSREQGIRDVTLMLERMDPGLAKKQLIEMIDKKQIERVVAILQGMQPRPRADILDEMTQEDDVKKVAEILKTIADGEPIESVVKKAQDELNKP